MITPGPAKEECTSDADFIVHFTYFSFGDDPLEINQIVFGGIPITGSPLYQVVGFQTITLGGNAGEVVSTTIENGLLAAVLLTCSDAIAECTDV